MIRILDYLKTNDEKLDTGVAEATVRKHSIVIMAFSAKRQRPVSLIDTDRKSPAEAGLFISAREISKQTHVLQYVD